CEEKLPTFFISNESKILSREEILHYNFHTKEELLTRDWLPSKNPVTILMTSGASCPDALVEGVIEKINSLYPQTATLREMTEKFL
ncbi:MAG TPA: 4-hydroxy-3-methylbut-2-enyl diphosphate reductase, partial [Chitinophagaceae bacterium]|nr:4-hydroxy-3-methylbut-2-enyl diphosphate reductase [Chitinophagaceae bacterium]